MDVLAPYQDDIPYATRRSSVRGTLIFGPRELTQSISGVDWGADSYFSERILLSEGSLDDLGNPRAIILPEKSATRLGIEVGESLLFKMSTISGQSNVGEFILIATTADQGSTIGESAYANLAYISELLNLESGEYQSLNLYLVDTGNTSSLSFQIERDLAEKATVLLRETREEQEREDEESLMRSMLMVSRGGAGGLMGGKSGGAGPGGAMRSGLSGDKVADAGQITYRITDLNDQLEPIMSLITILNRIGVGIYFALLIITMVGISNTFRMIMIERVGEIGTMRAVGMQKGQVRNLFLTEATAIALLGAAAGILVALATMFVLGLIPLSSQFGFFLFKGRLNFSVPLISIIRNIPILAALSLLAALEPAVALRTQY